MDGCDYDICEECRSCKQPENAADSSAKDGDGASGGDTQASSCSFLALQQEQEQEAAGAGGGTSLGFAHLDDVETRPYYTEVECHAFLLNYARLFRVPGSTQNKKILLLDELLTQVLYGSGSTSTGGQMSPAEVHQKTALSLLLKRMKLSHKIGAIRWATSSA